MNVLNFCSGFIIGFASVWYHKVIIKFIAKLFINKQKNEPTIKFICKITNIPIFNEYFPKFRNLSAPRTQPYWDFFENKNLIKININTPINTPILFENLLSDLDIPLFESFGKIYVYVHYKNLINIYLPESTIDLLDFEPKETELSIKYKNIIYAAFINDKTADYKTSYLKSFFNNTIELTPELLLFDYNEDNQDNVKSLKIVNKDFTQNLSLHEII